MSALAALAPFRSPSYRFQFPADLLTAWALETETLILGWFVLVETGSVMWLTVFASLQYVGTLISPLFGVAGDRLGLRTVLAAMRLAYTVFAAILLGFAIAGRLGPTVVMVVAAMAGLLKPSDIGMRSALVGATVPPAHLVAAMGLSRTTQDSARVAGALAGAGLIASFGMVVAYVALTTIYLGGMAMTLLIRVPVREPPAGPAPAVRPSPWRDLADGIAYVWTTPRLLAAMSLAALVNLTAYPLTGGLMPYIARDVFHLNQRGLGLLAASFAAGSFVGSMTVSLLAARIQPARAMLMTAVAWFVSLLAFASTHAVGAGMALLFVAGIAQSVSMVTLSILLLATSEQRFRGRIMGVRMLCIYTLPLGLLAAGALIPRLGFEPTAALFLLTGLVLVLEIGVSWRSELIRRDAVANSR